MQRFDGKDKTNGQRGEFCSNLTTEEYLREMQRPAAIKEDLWEMGRRRRVRQVLGAADFCSELEQLIRHDVAASVSVPDRLDRQSFLCRHPSPPSAAAFIQRLPQLPALNVHQMIDSPPIPIADIPPNGKSTRAETVARNKLATLYRLVDLFHWSQGIYNHITLRLSGTDPMEILINPFGLLYHEVTANSLIKLDLAGTVLDQGSTHLGVNQAAYHPLSVLIALFSSYVLCVLHLHTAVVAAVASMKCGLLPLCQEAMIVGPVAYHDYQGILTNEEEKRSIVRDLGDKNVLILRNHGFVACGQSVEDALHLAFHTIIACETQIRASRVGLANLIVPSKEAALNAYKTARKGGGGVNRLQNDISQLSAHSTKESANGLPSPAAPSWGIGELEWEAWCRVLDSAGYHTAHSYKEPPLLRRGRRHEPRHHSMYNLSSVATPSNGPASLGEAEEDEQGLAGIRHYHRIATLQSRAKWLNSPNRYQKVQLTETGTDHPRVITKWVQQQSNERSAGGHGGTPVKIHSPHQFSPCGRTTDPREFRERQRRMKETRLSSTVSPGPRSQLLTDGRTRAETGLADGSGALYIGTASKGIIDRSHQHNAQVYRCLYAQNPFNEMNGDLIGYLNEMESMESAQVRKSKSSPAIAEVSGGKAVEKTQQNHQGKEKVTSMVNGHEGRSASEEAKGNNGTVMVNGRSKDERNGGRTVTTTGEAMISDATDGEQQQQKRKKKRKRGRSFFASIVHRKNK
ncbi:hypothetical protein niasHT_005221 [Heterodera trifolii]|uniref:Class II aldolase/adducin N-terminal domain-containing protein n=1 Tax=Heterodera trifolii TaxID=157864 RepID=A0ABD2LRX3_9BILA